MFLLSSVPTSFIRPIASHVAYSSLFSTLELRLYIYCVISTFGLNYAFLAVAD
jgi:hypothetical protein